MSAKYISTILKNVITQVPTGQKIIPANMDPVIKEDEENIKNNDSYEFEPDEDEILENLLPKKYFNTNI